MSEPNLALLPDRSLVSITGEDAGKLLGGLITNDIDLLHTQPAIFAGLLSPQGKILFDFLVAKNGSGYLLDVASDKAGDLAKRLTMYRLRARATIETLGAAYHVLAAWGEGSLRKTGARPLVDYVDPRHRELGARAVIGPHEEHGPGGSHVSESAFSAYHAHRIALGIPEGGKDWDFGDAFPHEANFDLIHGVSFEKGCYVGQEIVARMEHRGTARKRVVRVTATGPLPFLRPDVMMGEVVIGRLGSVSGNMGLAMLRLDRAIEAIDKGEPITVDGAAIEIDAEMIGRQRRLMAEKAAQL